MDIVRLEQLIASGNDSAVLRVALGAAYLKKNSPREAMAHLNAAVALDPNYSAAWKLLAQAQTEAELLDDAERSYTHGITIATRRGDVQAAREMQVFLKRLNERRRSAEG